MAFDLGAIVGKLTLNIDNWTASIKTAKNDSNSLAGSIEKNKEAITELGKTMTIVGGAIVAAFALSSNAAKKLNESMAQVATLIPRSGERIRELKQDVQDLAVGVGKNTKDLTEGLYEVVSAFGDSADSVKILELNAKAAAAGMATTLDSIKLISAVTKGYGDTSLETQQKVADLAFQTVKLGQTTFPELATSIGAAVPLAKSLNIRVEELFATMATLTGVTGNASEVTTQMQAAMRGFMKQSEGMKKALKDLKVGTVEELIASRGLVGALRDVVGTTDGSIESVGKLFQRVEGLSAVLALTGSQAETFNKKFIAMKNSTGSAAEAFKEMTGGINKAGFESAVATEKINKAMIKLGDIAQPIFTGIKTAIASVIGEITKFADAHPTLFKGMATMTLAVGGLMAVVGPLLLALPFLAKSFTTLAPITKGLGGKIKGLIGPISKMGGAAMAAAAIIGTVVVIAIDKYILAMDKAIKKIKETAKAETNANIIIRNAYKNLTPEVVAQIKKRRKAMRDAGKEWSDINTILIKEFDLENAKGVESLKLFKTNTDGKIEAVKKLTTAAITANESAVEAIKKATMSEYNFSIWAINDKYDKQKIMLEKEKADKESLALNEKARQAELSVIHKDESEKRFKDSLAAYDKRAKAAQKFFKTLKKYEIKQSKDFNKLIKGTVISAREMSSKMTNYFSKGFAAIGIKGIAAAKKVKSGFSGLATAIGQYTQIMLQSFSTFFSSMNDLSNARFNQERSLINAEYQQKKKTIEDSLMNEAEKNAALSELDDEYATKKKTLEIEQAKANKKSGISQAIVNTALAITSGLSTKPFFPMGLIAAATAAVAGAIQIAAIKAAPLPGMAKGGLLTEATQVIAGEAGPEAFVPLPELKNMLGVGKESRRKGATEIIFNIKSWDSRDVKRSVQQEIAPYLKKLMQREAFTVPSVAVR